MKNYILSLSCKDREATRKVLEKFVKLYPVSAIAASFVESNNFSHVVAHVNFSSSVDDEQIIPFDPFADEIEEIKKKIC